MKQLKREIVHEFTHMTAYEVKLCIGMVLIGLLVMFGDIIQGLI